MTTALLRCFLLLLAVACGHNDTPVATYNVSPPDDPGGETGAGGSADPGGGAAAGGGSDGAPGGPLCTQTYPITVEGLTSRYKEGATRRSWVAAQRDCESEGGHLIVIDDEAENLWMSSVAAKSLTNVGSSHQLAWIGLSDHTVEGEFRWVTGAPISLEFWADMEPNDLHADEDCVEIRATGRWNDDRCDAELAYVCECDGASSLDNWCDTGDVATCGDCSTACAPGLDCIKQQCQ